LSQEELTPSQRTELVKKVLTALRYPKMEQMEKAFEKRRRNLTLPPNLSIHHPSFFEGRGLRVEFHIETMEEYRSILNSLSNLADKEEFQDMLET
ncbi:MAG TPA: hypothetical protein VLW47_09295, partial [Thermodesulfobacteriota bacterium]|nr:hypothetical protein [Thermodesulfobacteriota bacterium]